MKKEERERERERDVYKHPLFCSPDPSSGLSQYTDAFRQAHVDGDELLELSSLDMNNMQISVNARVNLERCVFFFLVWPNSTPIVAETRRPPQTAKMH